MTTSARAVALDVADLDEALDDRGPGGGRADARLLHGLAQLLVIDELARRLHDVDQRAVAVAPGRLGLLGLGGDLEDLDLLALGELGQLLLAALVVVGASASASSPYTPRQPGTSRRLPRVRNTWSATVVSTRVFSNTASGWKMARKRRDDEVVDAPVVVVHPVDRMVLGQRRDDRVVVGDLLVVDHAAERQHVEAQDVLGGLGVLGALAHQPGDRLDVGDHVAGDVARVRARVGQRLVILVEALGRGQRAPGGEAEAARGVASAAR